MPASSAETELRFSVYSHIHSKKRNRLTNVQPSELLYVSNNENLLMKKQVNKSISISDTFEDFDFEEVDWHEEYPNAEDNIEDDGDLLDMFVKNKYICIFLCLTLYSCSCTLGLPTVLFSQDMSCVSRYFGLSCIVF